MRFLGRVPDDDTFPRLYACADVFAMPCRERWGGLEAEGFGIVFLEAAAAGVPAVAGRSGGSHEAVVDGETGFVVESRALDVRAALAALLADDDAAGADGRGGRVPAPSTSSPTSGWWRGWRRSPPVTSAASGPGMTAGTLGAPCRTGRRSGVDLGADIDVERWPEGRRIVATGWVANALFAVTAIPVALGVDDLLGVAIGVALLLFLVSVGVFVYAFARRRWRAAAGATTSPSPTCSSSRARRPSPCGASSS